MSRAARRGLAAMVALVACVAVDASAQERFAVIVSGASGGPPYAQQYAAWADDLSRILRERMKLVPANVVVLEEDAESANQATAMNVRRALSAVRAKMAARDLLLIVLIGHGTFDGTDAKFNLVGPDLESAEWASLLDGLPGRLVIANTAAAGFPFLQKLAGPRRVVISATDNAAQRYDTVFPGFFIHAFEEPAADIDKNGRVSIWEAFAAATTSVRRYYQRQGQLATERALLDDTGDGIGHEPGGSSDDGTIASSIYLDVPDPGAPPTDDVLVQLLQRRAALEGELEELRIRKQFLPPPEYQQEFERIMLALAKVQREIRERRGSV
ncbi:MAG: hypothetical protein ABIX28_20930 [Vicinamibacterales bacterium]